MSTIEWPNMSPKLLLSFEIQHLLFFAYCRSFTQEMTSIFKNAPPYWCQKFSRGGAFLILIVLMLPTTSKQPLEIWETNTGPLWALSSVYETHNGHPTVFWKNHVKFDIQWNKKCSSLLGNSEGKVVFMSALHSFFNVRWNTFTIIIIMTFMRSLSSVLNVFHSPWWTRL